MGLGCAAGGPEPGRVFLWPPLLWSVHRLPWSPRPRGTHHRVVVAVGVGVVVLLVPLVVLLLLQGRGLCLRHVLRAEGGGPEGCRREPHFPGVNCSGTEPGLHLSMESHPLCHPTQAPLPP